MKLKNLLALSICILIFSSCEIVQEIKFEENGGGKYSLGFDMSEMMKMGATSKSDSSKAKQLDTLINFSKFLEERKDSIAKLSKKEREKIELLKDFELYMKSDTATNQLVMNINYYFKDINDLNKFGEKLKDQNVKELDLFNKQLKPKNKKDSSDDAFPDFNKSFTTTFTKKKFTRKITEKAYHDAVKKKDTTMKKDNPMSNMIRFKQRFIFPYKIKSVSNKNVRILSDFKGIEQDANFYEMNNDPTFFDVEVEFENE